MKVLTNCKSNTPHLQQLYTGLFILHQSGKIRLSQRFEQCKLDNSENCILEADVEGRKVIFDTKDANDIHYKLLHTCDYYFKRSYLPEYISEYHGENQNKIYPLGLNYWVLPDRVDIYALQRSVYLPKSLRSKYIDIITSIDSKDMVRFRPRLRHLHSLPNISLVPKVLFMVTAYDPYDKPDRPKDKIEERIHNNEVRANCVRMLRKELGSHFYGGFVHNEFTLEKYRDILIDSHFNTKKENYLQMLKNFPICVATTGLHKSIGWKFAEYVAFSRAIVSEPLNFRVPGNLAAGKHYLEFSTPDQCVEQCLKLLDNNKLRFEMMKSNHKYYRNYLKPDVLVWNAFLQVVTK